MGAGDVEVYQRMSATPESGGASTLVIMESIVKRAMAMMHKHDPQTQEDGFNLLTPVVTQHCAELIDHFETETDPGVRRWLLELIGMAQSDQALTLLKRELDDDDESLREWAQRGLQQLNSKQARTILRERGLSA